MKVLHVISDRNIGGAGILLLTLLRKTDTERVQSMVALPEGSALANRIERLGIPCFFLKHDCDRISFASVLELCSIIRTQKPDIVHANAALAARIAGKQMHIPVVFTRHCCFPPKGIWKNPSIRQIGGFFNRKLADAAIATANAAAENLAEYGIPKEKIHVIINGSLPIREVPKWETDEFLKRFSIKEGDYCIGICARLQEYKGQDVFLQGAKLLSERYPHIPFCFIIAGEGPFRRELEEMTAKLGLSDRVRFTGFIADMAPVYRLLRINVNCSSGTETSCLALSEGMSASLPGVVSNYGGNGDMVEDGVTGYIIPPKDPKALADALGKIVADGEREAAMRRASYERYLQKYTAEQMCLQLTAVYESLLKMKDHRGNGKVQK